MPTYKTPDVYVEEISIFPPSVAEVETAIPAFIGYTAKATKLSGNDLLEIPTKISSLLDFETYFGKAAKINLSEVVIDENNNFLRSSFTNNYYLYDSIRLFFDNGGGNCYIVAVGFYSEPVDQEKLKKGIDALKKYDEPTILLFPDAAGLDADKLSAVQIHALSQCAKLGDRVGILDTRSNDLNGTSFREKIGINNLKYGAAYTPWLKVNYPKNVSYKDVKSAIKKGAATVNLNTLTTDTEIQAAITRLDVALSDTDALNSQITTRLAGIASLTARYDTLLTAYKNSKTLANMQALFGFLFEIASLIDGFLDSIIGVKGTELKKNIEDSVTNSLKNAFGELIGNEKELDGKVDGAYTPQWEVDPDPSATQWGNIFTSSSPAASTTAIPSTATTDETRSAALLPNINKNFSLINEAINSFISGALGYVSTYEKSLYDRYPIYQNIIRGINDTSTTIPPSGAIAGIYAMVDGQRGVWKAPANVSLASVIEPTYNFDLSETDSLNVDANAGKSINAIRSLTGKGTLVLGARTLAGNDNEWRYISVRRFFNMVEESVKKSTFWAVFEPNDANTWVKVRGMIENYLNQKWREGALAGATPKDAFFVKCGLGITMTAQDILEGRMNVEIGMAVVRPAEFIILKFSHKLQTS
ncbi:phage tail sheath family protein [Pseudanabaena sp. PCC 6802]|uniref:phage tail sheath family protein n=1 Tax=Pseudanabaena sp. PCC 6802 TaxID=118173 RepID=UPI00034BB8B6|nr:phage tail sheath C-terminal domain-containing protein [Pseudanabaena sp. PCC 6802]